MRVFVTGATGFIGSAVVQELIGEGHQVLGLVRSDASAAALAATGAEVHRGDLEDLDSLRSGATACDGVIHLAFIHDFSNYRENCEIDKRAIEAMGAGLAGSGKPFVGTSGTLLLGYAKPGIKVTEEDSPGSNIEAIPRIISEQSVLALASQGVRASVIRLSPSVHGDNDHGFVPMIINFARQSGVSAYIDEGNNRWPAVHRLDAALLYRLALEKAAAGDVFHGVADEGVAVRDIAEVISRKLDIPLVSNSREEAAAHFTWMTNFLALDNPTSSKLTQEKLGWTPNRPGLIEDLEKGTYF